MSNVSSGHVSGHVSSDEYDEMMDILPIHEMPVMSSTHMSQYSTSDEELSEAPFEEMSDDETQERDTTPPKQRHHNSQGQKHAHQGSHTRVRSLRHATQR